MEYLDLFNHYRENKQIPHLNREEILDVQLKKFRKLVKHALTVSPFYREYYASAGITIDDIEGLHPADCPLTNKKMLMENFDRVVADPGLKFKKLNQFLDQNPDFRQMYNNYWIIHTSGSGGCCGIFPYSKKEFKFIKIYYLECIQQLKPFFKPQTLLKQIINKKRMVYFGAIHGHFAGVTLACSIPDMLYDHSYFSVLSPLKDSAKAINGIQPHIITGYASSVSQLAEAQLQGSLNIKPELIFTSGDAMSPSARELIQNAFGVNPVNLYSSSEAPVLGWQADDGSENMYIGDHMYHFDQVDDKVCLSNLYLYTFPIIRYHMDDTAAIQPHDGTQPFTKIKLKNVRALDVIEVINNQGLKVELPPLALVSIQVDGLEQYQYCKMPNNTILVKAKGNGGNLCERVKEEVLHILEEKKADKVVRLEVEHVDHIPCDPKTGKFKVIKAA